MFRNLDSLDDPAAEAAMETIGRDATALLAGFERDLRAQRVADRRVAAARDAMVDALQFRQRQMSATRRTLGDTPLREVETTLAASLRRWRLSPRPPPASGPKLASATSVLANLRRMADWKTDSTIVAASNRQLFVIDVDENKTEVIDLGLPDGTTVDGVVAVASTSPVVVVLAGGKARARYVHTSGLPNWETPATAIAAGPHPFGLWVANGSIVTEVSSTGDPSPAITLPRARRMVASAGERLVLTSPGLEAGPIEAWDPRRPSSAPVPLGVGSFVAAGREHVAFQVAGTSSLRIVPVSGGSGRTVDLPPTDAGAGAFSESERFLAFAAGPLAGRLASMVEYDSVTSRLTGLGGPSADIAGGVVWSEDRRSLFWLTADGRIAVHTDGEDGRILRVPYGGLRKLVGIRSIGG